MTDLKQLARRMFAAISNGDISAIRDLCNPGVEHIEAGGTHQGIDAVAAHFATLAEAFPDLEIVIVRQLESSNAVTTEMRFTGTQTGPLATPQGTLPPSGRKVDLPGCAIHDVEDGRITRHTGYYDQLLFMTQLGLMPQPAQG